MSGKYKHRLNESNSTTEEFRRSALDDLELIVEGKRVKTNTGLLIYNSSVFATLISNARATREADDNDITEFVTFRTRDETPQRLKLEIPQLKYKDVKTMIGCLPSSGLDKEDITGVKALRILPLVEQFRMSRLKKACGKALYDSLIAMRKNLGIGCIPAREILQYLDAADLYNFDKVRKLCVEELAANTDASNRKQIIQDKHVSDKSKLKIMDRMCDKMGKDYEDKLKQVRLDMDQRCREIEKRRDEFLEQLETWKYELGQEVEGMLKINTNAHKQLVEDLKQKKITDRIGKTMQETKESLFAEMKQLKDQMNFVYEAMETKEIIDDMEATRLRETLEEAQENNYKNVESIAYRFKTKVEDNCRACSAKDSTKGFSSGYDLQENVCKTIKDLEEKIQTLAVNQVRYEEERFYHEKTKAELMKLKIREHEINTWLKWAKPAVEDEEKCMCFRHTMARK